MVPVTQRLVSQMHSSWQEEAAKRNAPIVNAHTRRTNQVPVALRDP